MISKNLRSKAQLLIERGSDILERIGLLGPARKDLEEGSKSAVRRFFAGYDPAKINDRSAFCLLEKMDDGSLETRMLINLQGMDYSVQVAEVIRICKDYNVLSLAVDATGHEQLHEDLVKGLGRARVKKIVFSKQVKEDLTLQFRLLCQDRKIRFGRKLRFYQNLRKEMHDLDPEKLDHPKGGSSDLYWSVALAVHASIFNYVKARRVMIPLMDR
jgi:phage FluMu gp28-like protein